METCDQHGEFYKPETLYRIVCNFQRFLRNECDLDIDLFNKNDHKFKKFRTTLDGRMKQLSKQGYGIDPRKQAEPFTDEEESKLWEHAFDLKTSRGWSYLMYYYNCKLFGLRSRDEHRGLCANQFEFGSDECGEFVIFNGGVSKTYQGGVDQIRKGISYKNVKQYSISGNEKDFVKHLKQYLEFLPDKGGPFYRTPLPGDKIKFGKNAVGINQFANWVNEMCFKSGITGRKTGHSGKATTCTTLYQKGLDEQLIQERSGHRSVDALRKYKRTSNQQIKEVSEMLLPSKKRILDCFKVDSEPLIVSEQNLEVKCDLLEELPKKMKLEANANTNTVTIIWE